MHERRPPLNANPAGRTARRLLLLAGLGSLVASAGCLGPQAIKQTRMRYNEVVRSTNDEQLLMNIVRLRYADSPVLIDLPNITSQFEVTTRGAFVGGLDGQGPGRSTLGTGEVFIRDAPTLSYQPRTGDDIGRSLLTPVAPEVLRLLVSGSNLAPLLHLLVNEINDVPNAPQATALIPDSPGENARLLGGLELLASLLRNGNAELVIETNEVTTSDPVDAPQVRGRDLLEAARAGYVFREAGTGRLSLKKRQKNLAVRIHPEAMRSPEMAELAAIFHVDLGLDTYLLKSELYEGNDDDDFAGDPNPLGKDTLQLNMRSLLQVMTFLSKGVCVPAEHLASGVAPSLRNADGQPHDWTPLTRGLFRVASSKSRPRDAEVAVFYKGYWFSIDDADPPSKATLTILDLLISIQESGGEEVGPVLTLPVG